MGYKNLIFIEIMKLVLVIFVFLSINSVFSSYHTSILCENYLCDQALPIIKQDDFIKLNIEKMHNLNLDALRDIANKVQIDEITNSNPDCQNGMHWTWINSKINLGLCVRDYDQNCKKYAEVSGECEKCQNGYEPITTKWY